MKHSKYTKLQDCEGIEIDKETIFRFACCDCGLVHDMVIADEEDEKSSLAVRRNSRATAQLRRHSFGYLQQRNIGKYSMKG